MRRQFFVAGALALAALLTGAAPAQTAQPLPPGARMLRGEQKIEFIARRLNLTADQKKTYDSLMDVYKVSMEDERRRMPEILQQIRELMTELSAAEAAKDTAKAEAIRTQIGKLRPGLGAEKELFDNLSAVLTEEQRQDLALLRDWLDKGPPDTKIAPMEVLKLARGMNLASDQDEKLRALENDFRTKINDPANAAESVRDTLYEQLVKDIASILTPPQAEKFRKRLELLKPDPSARPTPPAGAAAPAAPKPATPPAAPPAATPGSTPPPEPGKPADPPKPTEPGKP